VQSFGEIVNTKIMRDATSKVSRGFGFVCFAEGEDAQKAVTDMNNTTFLDKKLYVAFAQPKAVRAQQMQDITKTNMVPAQMLPYAGGRMNPMAPAMQGMANMGFMSQYPGMMQFANGRPMMMNPAQFQMQGGNRNMQNGPRGGNSGSNPMLMQNGMQMQMMGGLMAPGMMAPGGMMPAAMGGQRGQGGRGGRGGRARGGAPGGPAGRMPGFAGPAGRGGPAGPARAGGRDLAGPPMNGEQMGQSEPEDTNLAAKLAGMTEEDQKQHLGELLFPRIEGMLMDRFSTENASKIASKVTGMFLEMDTTGLLYLLDTDQECSVKIEEALEVLRTHSAMPEGCA
jgi:polyadenylate-binding protein